MHHSPMGQPANCLDSPKTPHTPSFGLDEHYVKMQEISEGIISARTRLEELCVGPFPTTTKDVPSASEEGAGEGKMARNDAKLAQCCDDLDRLHGLLDRLEDIL